MSDRTPVDTPPLAGEESRISAFVSETYIKAIEPASVPSAEQSAVEPGRSFFRGVAVGIAIMIPIWAWVLMRLFH